MRRLLLTIVLLAGTLAPAIGQQTVRLDLDRTLQLAKDSSLVVRRYLSEYDVSRYNYLSWKASRLPQLSLESTPLQFERYMTRRYLSEQDVDTYRQQRYIYSEAGVTASQAVSPLGGEFYVTSQLGYMRTFGSTGQNQFMSIPFAMGYKQDLLFFNPLKWEKLIANLELTQAEKELAYNIESNNEDAVNRFFTLALAEDQMKMCEEYLSSCDTIFAIAERRYRISSISKAELSILELERVNAENMLANARIARGKAQRELATVLNLDPSADIEVVLPEVTGELVIDPDQAVMYAQRNNPNYVALQLASTEARKAEAKARVEKNLNLGADVSVGYNQVSTKINEVYRNLLPQDQVSLSLNVPLLDWGKRRNAWLAARSKVDALDRTKEQAEREIEQDVMLAVDAFNERKAMVDNSRQALEIAEEAYTQTMRRFMLSQADVYDLSLAQTHWQNARQNLIASLQNYWVTYYHLRALTLFDFQHQQPIVYDRAE